MAKKDEKALKDLMESITGSSDQPAPRNAQEQMQQIVGGQQAQAQAQGQQNPGAQTGGTSPQNPWANMPWIDQQTGQWLGGWNPSPFGQAGASPTDAHGQYNIQPYMPDGTVNPQWVAAGGADVSNFHGPMASAPTGTGLDRYGNWSQTYTDVANQDPSASTAPIDPTPGQADLWQDSYDGTGTMDAFLGSHVVEPNATASNPGWGSATAGKYQALSRMYSEPLTRYIGETIQAKGAIDKTKEEGYQKRISDLGSGGLSSNNPYGTGTIAAQTEGELAKQAQAAGLKTGQYDAATGTFTGGTLDAETQAAIKLEAEKRKAELGEGMYANKGAIYAKGQEERKSIDRKAAKARENMGHHQGLLAASSQNIMNNLNQVQAPFANMFGLGGQGQGGGGGQGAAGMNNMNNMFNYAGQGQRQDLAHGILGGQVQPFAGTTANVPQMVGGQGGLLGLQGGMQAQQAAQLGANQQMGQLGMKAGQNLYGQFNPQLANQYAMQRPFAQAAGQGIGAISQAAGGALAGMSNVGASV